MVTSCGQGATYFEHELLFHFSCYLVNSISEIRYGKHNCILRDKLKGLATKIRESEENHKIVITFCVHNE